MHEINRANLLLQYSEINFVEQVRKFAVPEKINGLKVRSKYSLSIGECISIWNIRKNDELLETTKTVFLLNTKLNRLKYRIFVRKDERFMLIDFSRLLLHTQETGEFIAKKFAELKSDYQDEQMHEIAEKYKGGFEDMIARYCKLYPAHTQQSAMQVNWYDMYLAFKSDVRDNNIQMAYAEIKTK